MTNKPLLIALLLAAATAASAAQMPCQRIVDTINNPDGTPYNGTITATLSYETTSGSSTVQRAATRIPVVRGALSTCLAPAAYTINYNPDVPGAAVIWKIPTGGTGTYALTSVPTGIVNTASSGSTYTVTFVSGINFALVAPGDTVNIAGLNYPSAVLSVPGISSILLNTTAGTQTGVLFSDGPIQQSAPSAAIQASYGLQGPPGSPNVVITHVYSAAGTFNFVHNLNTATPEVQCYVSGAEVAVTPTYVDANTTSIYVGAATTLTCVFNASGGGGGGGGGGTGTVTAVTCGAGLSGGTFTTAGTCTVNLPSATATATLGVIVDGDCVQTSPFTLTGAALGSILGASSSLVLPSGVTPSAKAVGSNSVVVSICNNSESSYTASSATYTAVLVH